MRKLKLQVQISVDGFIAGPNGEMDWMVWNWDDELNKYITELTEPVDCILLGRILAQGFIPYWESMAKDPNTSDWGSRKMADTFKVVFTKTLQDSEWNNTVLAKGDLAEEITRLKSQPGKDMIVYGGSRFVSSLIQHGLIDEYHLVVNPAAIGDGLAIFKGLEQKLNLKLAEARSFECGIVVLKYLPA